MLNFDKSKNIGLIVCASYFVTNVILNIICNFQQTHNDYWDLLFMAKHIDWSDRNTLFNQCTTSGYPLFLYFLIVSKSDIILPTIINLLVGTFAGYALMLFLHKVNQTRVINILSFILYCFFPINFLYFNQGGGDPLAVFLFTSGTLLLVKDFYLTQLKTKKTIFYYGFLVGLATLFRPHLLISSLFFIAILLILNLKKKLEIFFFSVTVLCLFSFQIFINILSGHNFFETKLGSPLIHSLMFGNNWFKITTQEISLSTLDIIKIDVFLFVKKYFTNIIKYFFLYGLFPVLSFIVSKDKKNKNISFFLTIFILFYLSFFSAFFSRRMPLLILPFTMICFGIFIDEMINYCKNFPKTRKTIFIKTGLYSFLILFFIAVISKDFFYFKMRYKESKIFIAVENYLKKDGCTSAFQTFTTDFNFYFRTFPEHTGHINGGWSRIGTYKFNEVYPEMSVNTLDDFVNDCKKNKIKFLILTKDAYLLLDDIGKIYSFDKKHPSLMFKKEIDRFRIFEIS